jgi:hypothetical protein
MVSGNITATLPLGFNGSGYKARVVSSNPSRISSDLVSVTVNTIPNAIATTTQPTCATATGTINVTSPAGAGLTYSIGGAYQSSSTFSGLQAATYNVSVRNGAGCSSAAATSVTVNPQPFVPLPTTVTGQVNVCNLIGTGTTTAYTASAPGATAYRWVLPANTQLVSATSDSSTINIRFLNGFAQQVNKQLRVTPQSICGNGSIRVFYLAAQLPTTPSAITASTGNVCPSLGTNVPITFTIPKVQGAASYVWAAQNGTTNISSVNGSGENDTAITVTFNSNFSSSSITVYALNTCGASGTRSFFLSRSNPSRPSLITGPVNVCEYNGTPGTNPTYFVIAASNVETYTWTAPQGTTIVSGQGTSQLVVRYPQGFTSGTLSVVAANGCGTSSERSLAISANNASTPSPIDVINLTPCPNRTYSYTIAALPANATSVVWTAPAGATLVSGQGTTSITVAYPSGIVTGAVTVRGMNNCSMSSLRTVQVKLPPCPSGFAGNPTTRNTEVAEVKGMGVKVFPNPTTSNFSLQVAASGNEAVKVRILDAQGRMVKQVIVAPYQTVQLGAELKSGVYLIEARQGQEVKTERVVKY